MTAPHPRARLCCPTGAIAMIPVPKPLLACLLLVAGSGQLLAQKQPATGFHAALARYQECLQRLPFQFHTEGRQQLAETRQPEALRLLLQDYAEAKVQTEYARYTLAELFGSCFDDAESVAPLLQLRKAHTRPVDVWLWAQTLKVQSQRQGDEAALALAKDGKNPQLRAAAIVGLMLARRAAVWPAIAAAAADFPKPEGDRLLLLGAMSAAFLEGRTQWGTEACRTAFAAYINLLAPAVNLSAAGKLMVSRHLKWTLGGPARFEEPGPWLELLARREVKAPLRVNTVVQPRFFGIETEGDRIGYVIDLSDSMCKPIPDSVRPKAALTGPRQRKQGELPDETDLPWFKIRSRFDLLREELRISLLRLPKEKSFAVVWFGDGCGTLDATKGLVKASKANVDRALAELDAIVPGKPEPLRAPDGVLRGATNLHGGLRHGLSLTDRGYVETAAFVDPAVLVEGCDTLFVLSDGAPTVDEFVVTDRDYHEGEVVLNQEYGAKVARTEQIHYPGPYVQEPWLLTDLRRMNTFRRVRIHCVGIGEANMGLLRQIAGIGHGESFEVGRDKVGAGGGNRAK